MHGEPAMGDPGTLVIARDDEDRHTPTGDLVDGFESLVDQGRRDAGPVEDVATVYHEIDLAPQRRPERPLMVGQEIVTAPPTPNARPCGQVETKVAIGEEQNAEDRSGLECTETKYGS